MSKDIVTLFKVLVDMGVPLGTPVLEVVVHGVTLMERNRVSGIKETRTTLSSGNGFQA